MNESRFDAVAQFVADLFFAESLHNIPDEMNLSEAEKNLNCIRQEGSLQIPSGLNPLVFMTLWNQHVKQYESEV